MSFILQHPKKALMKMRFLFLSFEGGFGGSATYQAMNISYLLAHGCEVWLADEFPEYTRAKVDSRYLQSLNLLQVPVWSHPQVAARSIEECLTNYPMDVIAISNPGVLVRYSQVLSHARRKPAAQTLLTLHSGMLTMTWRRYLLEWATSFSCLQLDEVVYVSHFTQSYWQSRYPWMRRCPSRVVPNGVPVPHDLDPLGSKPRVLRVGFVGRLLKEKDPAMFCEVARLASTRSKRFEFHVYGDGVLETVLQRQYEGCAEWHGQVMQDQIYRNIDLLLMTSPVENCPYALLEAKSYGIPAVSAAVGGIPEILVSGVDGILAPSRTTEALLASLVVAADRLKELRAGCLTTRENYNVSSTGNVLWHRYLRQQT